MDVDYIEKKLDLVLAELVAQRDLALRFFSSAKQFDWEMSLCKNFIDEGEVELAHTQIIETLDWVPFTLTHRSAVALIELALICGFRTTAEEDRAFNFLYLRPLRYNIAPDLRAPAEGSPLDETQVAERIEAVLSLIDAQRNAFPPTADQGKNLDQQLSTIRSLLAAGELSLAYEGCVCLLDRCPVQVPGRVAVGLVELALTFKFKTHRVEDAEYVWDCDPAPIL